MIKFHGILNFGIIASKYRSNRRLVNNVIAAFVIKGAGLLINLASLPLYIRYLEDRTTLGVWFTMLTLVGWIISFDIGVGNGLRNKLTLALAKKDYEEGRYLISSSYGVMGLMTLFMAVFVLIVCKFVNWYSVFNIDNAIINDTTLNLCMAITLAGVLGNFFFSIVRGQIYALQMSSVNNFLHLSTSLFMVIIIILLPRYCSIESKLITLSITHAIISNIPYTVAAVSIHKFTILRNCTPSFKYISKWATKAVLSLGLSFFVAQLLHMFISVSNEFFITSCYNPRYCVDYQVYFRFFSLAGTLIMLALTPLWSAITKACAEKRYRWVYKLNRFLTLIALGSIVLQGMMLLIIQPLVNLWLGKNAITIDIPTAIIFLLYSAEMIWISVQSTIVAGLGKLNTQLIFYSIAVAVKIGIILVASNLFPENWEIVILATAIGLMPYCLIQPVLVSKLLRGLINEKSNI